MFSKKKKKQKTVVIIKPNTEKYTNKNHIFFKEEIENFTKENNLAILSEYKKHFNKEEAELHYKQLSLLGFFPKMIDYMISGESWIFLIEGEKAITKMDTFKDELRKKHHCHPGIFRWIFNNTAYKNILHTSDSKSEANREVERYFPKFIGK